MAYALNTILPQCRVNGVDQCNDNCKTLVQNWLASPCVENWGIRFMFDYTCANCKFSFTKKDNTLINFNYKPLVMTSKRC